MDFEMGDIMKKEELNNYKKKIGELSLEEQKLRRLYLRELSLGEIQGPGTGYLSIDKPWLKYYSEEAHQTLANAKTFAPRIYFCSATN